MKSSKEIIDAFTSVDYTTITMEYVLVNFYNGFTKTIGKLISSFNEEIEHTSSFVGQELSYMFHLTNFLNHVQSNQQFISRWCEEINQTDFQEAKRTEQIYSTRFLLNAKKISL